jgi:hypothetical protein
MLLHFLPFQRIEFHEGYFGNGEQDYYAKKFPSPARRGFQDFAYSVLRCEAGMESAGSRAGKGCQVRVTREIDFDSNCRSNRETYHGYLYHDKWMAIIAY